MSAQKMLKALFVFTECDKMPHGKEKATGWYLPEAAHPYFELINAGERDFIGAKTFPLSPFRQSPRALQHS
jgi:hypothetical protein